MHFPFGYLLLFVLFGLATAAFWHGMKVWCLTVQGVNLLFATLFAIGLFEPVANMLDGALGMMAFYNDMLAFMLVFLAVLAILMFVTSLMSKANLFFEGKTDVIAKWGVFFLVFVGFYGTGVFVFYETLPEKPATTDIPPTMKAIDLISKGSLKPLIGSTTFDSRAFADGQYKRNAAVYEQVVGDASAWKFDGDSPNAR